MTAEQHFRAVAPIYMRRLLNDFPLLTKLDAAAIFGNLGHESLGFTALQEIKPTVKGSRGGLGWAQWTGPRRRAYESYCARNGISAKADASNYAFLFMELAGSYQSALVATMEQRTLEAKVKAFEVRFEGAGVKHYDRRNEWARIALDALEKAPEAPIPASHPATGGVSPAPAPSARPTPPPTPASEPPIAKAGGNFVAIGIVLAIVLAALAYAFIFHPH